MLYRLTGVLFYSIKDGNPFWIWLSRRRTPAAEEKQPVAPIYISLYTYALYRLFGDEG